MIKTPYKIRRFLICIRTLAGWVNFIFKKPQRILFLTGWFLSFLPGRSAFSEGMPWVNFEAKKWLDSYLTKEMNVFEWGSGGSTLYLASRVKSLVSVEHNPEWHSRIDNLLREKKLDNCRYILKEPQVDVDGSYFSTSKRYKGLSFKEYCQIIELYPDNFFDLVVVDGRARPFCISLAIEKIRAGGFLFLDDSDGLEYSEGIKLLKNWPRNDFQGPKPYTLSFYQTTVWQKIIK